MNGFFLPQLLNTMRVLLLIGVRVENPPFYPMLVGMGFSNLPNFSLMAAITFSDVVVTHEPFTDRLLFHELVHVEQYRRLGISRFAELYVRGFLSGGSYDAIPLEVNAYTLDRRFDQNPGSLMKCGSGLLRTGSSLEVEDDSTLNASRSMHGRFQGRLFQEVEQNLDAKPSLLMLPPR